MIRLILVMVLWVWSAPETMAADATSTLFRNVNVISMLDDSVTPNQSVLVTGDRIRRIAPAINAPKGATIIEGNGRFLMPGLAEMHGHTPVPGGDPHSSFVEDMMFLYVANGVTLVRGMLGAPGQLELRERVASGDLVGPLLYLAGPSFSGGSISSEKQATQRVHQQVDQGWDLLKVHPGLSRSQYDAMAVAANERGIRFGGHVPDNVGLLHAIEMGQQTFDHLDGYLGALSFPERAIDLAALSNLVSLSYRARIAVVPTMVLWDHVIGLGDADEKLAWPENAYWPEERVGVWHRALKDRASRGSTSDKQAYSAARQQVLMALHRGGVTVLMGTDSPQIFSVPGFSLHREMAAMVKAGMTPYEVLVTGTRNVAEHLQGHHAVGLVAPGHRASLILVDKNPFLGLDTLRSPAGVMTGGQWIPASKIRERLEAIRHH